MTTLTLQPDATDGIDTWFRSTNPTFNYGIHVQIQCGTVATTRGLVQFSLTTIPAGATITLATLWLYCSVNDGDNNANPIGVHRGLSQWFEGTKNGAAPGVGEDGSTYNLRNANGAVAWLGGAGGGSGTDYAAVATATTDVTVINAWYSWVVTADLVAWLGGTANYGHWLVGTDTHRKIFHSSDYATDITLRPKLVVEYTSGSPLLRQLQESGEFRGGTL